MDKDDFELQQRMLLEGRLSTIQLMLARIMSRLFEADYMEIWEWSENEARQGAETAFETLEAMLERAIQKGLGEHD